MDLVLKLREVRRMRGLSQTQVAKLSGVGSKTISSFETGKRIGSLKIVQLRRLLAVYGFTEEEFFGRSIEREVAPWELDANDSATARLLEELRSLPESVRSRLLAKFQLMAEAVVDAAPGRSGSRQSSVDDDWRLLTSRN